MRPRGAWLARCRPRRLVKWAVGPALAFIILPVFAGCTLGGPTDGERAQFQQALRLIDEGRPREAEALLDAEQTEVAARHGANSMVMVTILTGLATAYLNEERYFDAEQAYRQALSIAEANGDSASLPTLLLGLANSLQSETRLDDAKSIIERAIGILQRDHPNDDEGLAKDYSVLCGIDFTRNRFAMALPACQQAVEHAQRITGGNTGDIPLLANTMSQLGAAYVKLHRFAEAKPLLDEFVRLAIMTHRSTLIATTTSNKALLDYEQHNFGSAASSFDRATVILNENQPSFSPNVARILTNAASSLQMKGQPDKAYPYTQRSVDTIERNIELGANHGENYANSTAQVLRDHLIENVFIAHSLASVEPGRETQMAEETFRVPQLATISATSEAISRMAERVASNNEALIALVRRRQDLANHLAQVDEQLIAAEGNPGSGSDAITQASLRSDFETTRRSLEQTDGRIAAEYPAFAELSSRRPVSAAAVRALLRNDEAMLVYLVDKDEVMALGAPPGSIEAASPPGRGGQSC